jgi:hypothetical protein
LDNDIFYEFLALDDFQHGHHNTVLLDEVETNKDYVIIITTSSGLWRYMTGDTIIFTSLSPFRIKVSGRTKYFINAFGEELMVSNTDAALLKVCGKHRCLVNEYTIGPQWLTDSSKGYHEWCIEFEKCPLDLATFEKDLDLELQNLNSDYEAKRYGDLAISQLKINNLPKGTFLLWLESKGKMGGQNKIPRLANDRKILEEILSLIRS